MAHWKSPWCWERLKAVGEEGIRGCDGWTASLMQWMWTWANSGRWWGTGRPGVHELHAVHGVTESDLTGWLNDKRTPKLFSRVAVPSCIPPTVHVWFNFSKSQSAFYISFIFYFDLSDISLTLSLPLPSLPLSFPQTSFLPENHACLIVCRILPWGHFQVGSYFTPWIFVFLPLVCGELCAWRGRRDLLL